jgi:hypothetical protein
LGNGKSRTDAQQPSNQSVDCAEALKHADLLACGEVHRRSRDWPGSALISPLARASPKDTNPPRADPAEVTKRQILAARSTAFRRPGSHLAAVGLDLVLAGFAPDDQPDLGRGGSAQGHPL